MTREKQTDTHQHSPLTDDDVRAATVNATMRTGETVDPGKLAANIEKLRARKPRHGPGIDAPEVFEKGTLPDGREWWFRVGWSPFHACIHADFNIFGIPDGIDLTVAGSDTVAVCEAATNIVGRPVPLVDSVADLDMTSPRRVK